SARTLSLPLSFLGGGKWTSTVYADGTPGTSAYQTPVVVSTRTVTSATVLSAAMAPSGGQAVVLKPSGRRGCRRSLMEAPASGFQVSSSRGRWRRCVLSRW
ncbi:glycoside hydrolase family 97 C-terminal domain-containing protein, partial [Streptomyces sp. NPDC006265]|uniref:glycoside hydrolase family 97 C-terminal domain-containing protein n=1 Tax=Streptomyces sp. NPDC006265 TaxID=3156740 RepID=UPI0033AAFEC7